jgi:hypothetical protein
MTGINHMTEEKIIDLKQNKLVRLKCKGWRGAKGLLLEERYGFHMVYVDWGVVSRMPDEYSVMRDQTKAAFFVPMRTYLPYGTYFCKDGSEVLFSRDYCPLWKKHPSGEVADISPDEKINYEEQKWFFTDCNIPPNNKQTFEKCLSVLDQWGISGRTSLFTQRMLLAIRRGDWDFLRFPNRYWKLLDD